MQKFDIVEVVEQFQFEGTYENGYAYGFGHINDTYLISFKNGGVKPQRYILQRINHKVFKNPYQVMENIQRATKHLRSKISAMGGNPDRETLTPIFTNEGGSLYETANGSYWRAYLYIENTIAYDNIETLEHAYHGANTFALFQKNLIDFDIHQLYETIPDFHHTPKRYQKFSQAVALDELNRAKHVVEEIAFMQTREAGLSRIVDLLESGEIPVRVTHNDTKFNNVMLDAQTGAGVCVVDLDTVMPGSSLYDFGDAIRSGAMRGAEDEPDLAKVSLDKNIFETYTQGYLDVLRDVLTPLEIKLMPEAARLLTLECGMRFLTDYLQGDIYYKTEHETHNLDRCRTQFKLVSELEQNMGAMQAVVEKYR